jgi:hypothetical protein
MRLVRHCSCHLLQQFIMLVAFVALPVQFVTMSIPVLQRLDTPALPALRFNVCRYLCGRFGFRLRPCLLRSVKDDYTLTLVFTPVAVVIQVLNYYELL